jgi:heme-degrading monooxygenase HmoA
VPAHTPPPPYVAVIFSSVRTGDDPDGYARTADRMEELAARQPGYLGIESARGADGFGITVSYWATAAAARAWKQVAEHLAAQELGRERWYATYRVRIAEVAREYGPAVATGSPDESAPPRRSAPA